MRQMHTLRRLACRKMLFRARQICALYSRDSAGEHRGYRASQASAQLPPARAAECRAMRELRDARFSAAGEGASCIRGV